MKTLKLRYTAKGKNEKAPSEKPAECKQQ